MTLNVKLNSRQSADKGIICWNIANSNLSIKPCFCVREGNGGQIKNKLSFDLKIFTFSFPLQALSLSHFLICLLFLLSSPHSAQHLCVFLWTSHKCPNSWWLACEQYSRHPFPSALKFPSSKGKVKTALEKVQRHADKSQPLHASHPTTAAENFLNDDFCKLTFVIFKLTMFCCATEHASNIHCKYNYVMSLIQKINAQNLRVSKAM